MNKEGNKLTITFSSAQTDEIHYARLSLDRLNLHLSELAYPNNSASQIQKTVDYYLLFVRNEQVIYRNFDEWTSSFQIPKINISNF